jgi:hypothetical protein
LKTLVKSIATAVRRFPKTVVIVTVLVTIVLGMIFGGQFVPETDSNSSFAPDAPELAASEYISETFGSVAQMQVLTESTTGDVITMDGFLAAIAVDESVRSGGGAEHLVDSPDSPAVLSYLAPVFFAMDAGAPAPTSDEEVKALFIAGLDAVPAQFRSFLTLLLSADANLETATAQYGLTAITYAATDDFDESANRAVAIGASVDAADTPDSILDTAFSQELIFGSQDEFQTEILRLFASAALIILLVLAIVFVVKPSSSRDRGMFIAGIVVMVVGALVSVAPGVAVLFPDFLPESWGDAPLGPVLLTAFGLFAVAFILWSVGSRRLRRTTADTLITFLTIGLAIQWMNGYGFLRFKDQSQLVQILPILLIGLGVDYSIHMTTRYRQELSDGGSVDASMSRAIRTVGVALVLATLTTAVGFLTNVTNDIPALAEFGELAAVGIAFSFILMLTFVPAVRELLDRRAERNGRMDTEGLKAGEARLLPRVMGNASILPQRFAVATLVIAVLLTAVGAFGWSRLETKFSFLDFVPTTSPLRDTAKTIEANFDFPETTSVLVRGDVATGAAWNGMLVSYANTAQVDDVVTVETPSGPFPVGTTFMGVMFQFLNPSGPDFDADLFDVALEAGFGQDRTVPDDADLTDFYDTAVAGHPDVMSAVLAAGADGRYEATLFNVNTLSGETNVDLLADGLNEAFEPSRAAGLDSVATSNFIISDLVVTSLRESQQTSLFFTLGAALLLLVINFWYESRRPMLGLLTTLPVVMVVLWTFGIMSALGIPFGPVTAMISAIGIGIGIPYMIHVTHRYLEERSVSQDENDAIHHTLTHTGGALAGSALTTIFGFGILITSSTIPFQQFGFVLAYTILLALVAAVLVLPSMLVLWSRWHIKRGDEPVQLAEISEE